MIPFFVIMSWAEAGKNKKQGSILKSEGKSQIKIKKFESVFYTTGLSAQDRKKLWKGGQGTLMVLGNTPGVTQALTSVLKQKWYHQRMN